tara:strand:+ start:280 stop:843 length:564 start_codon:yes stop_codon:yes gene_type:complete
MNSFKNALTKTELMAGTLLILVAVLARIIPHPPNFTPIIAIALFSGHIITKSNKAIGHLIPLIIMFIADLFIGFHSTIIYVYLSIFIISIIGKRSHLFKSPKETILTSTIASILFFLITNTAIWFHSEMYTKTITGLWTCYVMAIPFFHNTLLSTLTFMGIIWMAFTFALKQIEKEVVSENIRNKKY